MSEGRSKMGRLADAAIAALLSAPSHAAAAAAVGIGEMTLARWLRNPTFLARYRDARRAVVEAAIGRLQSATGEAVEVLRKNLHCGQPSSEIRAALGILRSALEAIELVEIVERLQALEARRDKESAA